MLTIQDTVDQVCKQKNVDSLGTLCWLLALTADSHIVMSTSGFAIDANNRSNVLSEILRIADRGKHKVPVSILATLERLIEPQLLVTRLNLIEAKKAGIAEEIEALDRLVRQFEALILIIRELLNQSERVGITAALEFQKIIAEDEEISPSKPA